MRFSGSAAAVGQPDIGGLALSPLGRGRNGLLAAIGRVLRLVIIS